MCSVVTPWAKDEKWSLIGANKTSTLTAMLQATKLKEDTDDGRSPELHLYLDPGCSYKIEVQSNLAKMWGQMVRFYAYTLLGPFVVAACMLTLVQQLKAAAASADGHCPSFYSIVSSKVTPISVVMPSKILTALAGTAALAPHVAVTDFTKLQDNVRMRKDGAIFRSFTTRT